MVQGLRPNMASKEMLPLLDITRWQRGAQVKSATAAGTVLCKNSKIKSCEGEGFLSVVPSHNNKKDSWASVKSG